MKRYQVHVTVTEVLVSGPVAGTIMSSAKEARALDTHDVVHVTTEADDVLTGITRAINVLELTRTEFVSEDVDTTAWQVPPSARELLDNRAKRPTFNEDILPDEPADEPTARDMIVKANAEDDGDPELGREYDSRPGRKPAYGR
jgi:hypothetical protein